MTAPVMGKPQRRGSGRTEGMLPLRRDLILAAAPKKGRCCRVTFWDLANGNFISRHIRNDVLRLENVLQSLDAIGR